MKDKQYRKPHYLLVDFSLSGPRDHSCNLKLVCKPLSLTPYLTQTYNEIREHKTIFISSSQTFMKDKSATKCHNSFTQSHVERISVLGPWLERQVNKNYLGLSSL